MSSQIEEAIVTGMRGRWDHVHEVVEVVRKLGGEISRRWPILHTLNRYKDASIRQYNKTFLDLDNILA